MGKNDISKRKVYLMDTCTFIEFLNNDTSHFDIPALKKLIDDSNMFVVTPYTLYEYLIKVEDKNIRNITNKLAFNNDFYVLNVNHIFEDYEGYMDGRSFIFRFKMHTEDVTEFHNSMKELKEKVYKSLSKKFYLISGTIAILWLVYTESNNECYIDQDTKFKIDYIDKHFLKQNKKRYDALLSLEYEKEDIKYNIPNIITNFAFEMIGLSNVQDYLWKNDIQVDGNEYNRMIIEELNNFKSVFFSRSLYNVKKKYLKRTNKKFTSDYMKEWSLQYLSLHLLKDAYKGIVDKAFSKEGLNKKETNNDIIDFTNLCLIEDYAGIPVAYLTSEKKWLKYIMRSNEPCLLRTQEVVRKYIKSEYLEVINRN